MNQEYEQIIQFNANSGEILDKLKAGDFNGDILTTYDFSTLYTTLSHNLIKSY